MSPGKGRAAPQKQRRMIKMLATLSFMDASAPPLESHQKQAVELPSPVVLCTTILSRYGDQILSMEKETMILDLLINRIDRFFWAESIFLYSKICIREPSNDEKKGKLFA